MEGVLGLSLTGAANLYGGNVSLNQIGHYGQGTVVRTLGKVLELVWHSKLPQTSPKQPLILGR